MHLLSELCSTCSTAKDFQWTTREKQFSLLLLNSTNGGKSEKCDKNFSSIKESTGSKEKEILTPCYSVSRHAETSHATPRHVTIHRADPQHATARHATLRHIKLSHRPGLREGRDGLREGRDGSDRCFLGAVKKER